MSLTLVADRSRIATIVAFERAKRDGIQRLGGAPGEDPVGIAIRDNARLRLTALAQAGHFEVTVVKRFPLTAAAEAHWLLAKGGFGGRMALLTDDGTS